MNQVNQVNQVNQANQVAQPQVGSRPQSSAARFLQNTKFYFAKYKKILLSLLVIVGGLLLIKTLFFKPAVISVVGTGTLTAKPAKVEMLVTKVDSNPDPVLAILAGEESINTITAKAKEVAGDSVEIQKSFYQVTPSVVAGDVLYQVVNVFKITAQDPAVATDMVKGFYSSGVTTVSGVNFVPADQEKVIQNARKEAIKDAKNQARNIARSAGKRVGRIISISDDQSKGNSTVSTNAPAAADGAADKQTNYTGGSPSEIDVSKSMTVTYEIW